MCVVCGVRVVCVVCGVCLVCVVCVLSVWCLCGVSGVHVLYVWYVCYLCGVWHVYLSGICICVVSDCCWLDDRKGMSIDDGRNNRRKARYALKQWQKKTRLVVTVGNASQSAISLILRKAS